MTMSQTEPRESADAWLGLDVGGANIKAAHEGGMARAIPFELWKRPDDLPNALATLFALFPRFDRLALTMTAELCDCYETKAEGVVSVLDAVVSASDGRPVCVWTIDASFRDVSAIRDRPALAAASNWLALAEVAARLIPEGPSLLIDIGSTTADLIPMADGRARAIGRTDTVRLATGELVYAGVRRTPVCALATELRLRGVATGVAAELFASTLDVYLTLGDTPPDPNDLSTADGRPATREAARDRLARMVGADRDGFSPDDALALARSADEALLARLESAARRACDASVGPARAVVVAGSGEFLARRLAHRLIGPDAPIVSLRDAWGPVTSIAAPAHALVILARERARP